MKSAEVLFTYVWDKAWGNNKCDGGLVNNEEKSQRTAEINALAVQISAELGGKFLNTSKTIWKWLKGSGLVNENDIVGEYMDEECKRRTHRQVHMNNNNNNYNNNNNNYI